MKKLAMLLMLLSLPFLSVVGCNGTADDPAPPANGVEDPVADPVDDPDVEPGAGLE